MELIRKLDKTKKDINLLILQNKNLVYYMLSSMNIINNHDAESAAWEALWDSINRFDIFADNEFSTFACTVIRNAINNVLRKQQIDINNTCVLEDLTLAASIFICDDICNADTTRRVLDIFNSYVVTKHGVYKNVLLVWQSSNFAASATEIAKVCSTSSSYVGRVQCSFRAYLAGQIRES